MSCEPGEYCGAWKQVVWNTTNAVGCGATMCDMVDLPGGVVWANTTIVACNYRLPANLGLQNPY